MKEIIEKLKLKIDIEIDKIYLLYNGQKINVEMIIEDIINNEDRNKNEMNIIVYDINNTIINENIKQSEDIICPECKNNTLIKIEDYKIRKYNCKNKHNNLLLLKEYENSQNIDISQIKCEICKIKNKSNTYNNEMHKCITCDKNLCPLCKSTHDKNHKIINYDNINNICNKHNNIYIKYCKQCNENICMLCEKDHKLHDIIYFGDILPNNNNIKELKEYINKLNIEINEIISKLEDIKINMEKYYNISNNIINNENNQNYYILNNKNEFINNNNIIIKDIKEIINDNKVNTKIIKLLNIYDKMDKKEYNYIIGEIEIKEENVGKKIQIINSYENIIREGLLKPFNDEYKYKNEKEIKEKCMMELNDEIIPFSYYYKFNEKGKYKIKYKFNGNLKILCGIFLGCNSITNIDLSNFITQNVINMNGMFYGCSSLTNIGLSNFDTKNVTNMNGMFSKCKSLKIKSVKTNDKQIIELIKKFLK